METAEIKTLTSCVYCRVILDTTHYKLDTYDILIAQMHYQRTVLRRQRKVCPKYFLNCNLSNCHEKEPIIFKQGTLKLIWRITVPNTKG